MVDLNSRNKKDLKNTGTSIDIGYSLGAEGEGNIPLGIPNIDREGLKGIKPGSIVSIISSTLFPIEMLGFHLSLSSPVSYYTLTRPEEILERKYDYFSTEAMHASNQLTKKGIDFEFLRPTNDFKSILREVLIQNQNPHIVFENASPLFDSGTETFYNEIFEHSTKIDGLTYLLFPTTNNQEPISEEIENAIRVSDAIIEINEINETQNKNFSLYFHQLPTQEVPDDAFEISLNQAIRIESGF